MNSFFASNVRFLRERKGISQGELSLNLKMTRAKIASYETNHTKNPSLKDLHTLSEYFSISIDVLLKLDLSGMPDYKLKMFEEVRLTGADLRVVVTTVNSDNKETNEFLPLKAKAGYLVGYADPDFISKLPTFELPHLPKGKKYRMFPTQGDSMLPIPEGALIICEYIEDWLSIKDGQLCVIITKTDGIVFKQVTNKIKVAGSIILNSLNSFYNPFTLLAEDILEIWKYNSFISENIPNSDDFSIRTVHEEIKDLKIDLKKILQKVNG